MRNRFGVGLSGITVRLGCPFNRDDQQFQVLIRVLVDLFLHQIREVAERIGSLVCCRVGCQIRGLLVLNPSLLKEGLDRIFRQDQEIGWRRICKLTF